MNARHMFAGILSFAVGVAALPFALSSAAGNVYAPALVHHSQRAPHSVTAPVAQRGTARAAHSRLADSSRSRMGTSPALFELINSQCRGFSGTTQVDLSTLKTDDPRFQPCIPTVNNFGIVWYSAPTAMQVNALRNIMNDLAKNQPKISFDLAKPLITAALLNAQ